MKKQNQKDRQQHDRRLLDLQSLFELSKTLNSSLQQDVILDTLLFTPMGRMMIGRGAVLLNEDAKTCRIAAAKGLPQSVREHALLIEERFDAPAPMPAESDSPGLAFLYRHGLRLLCPIHSNKRQIGYLVLGEKITGAPFSPDELQYLEALANLASSSLENSRILAELRDVNRRLDKKIQQLNTLFEITRELNSTLDRDKIATTLSYAVMGEMMIRQLALAVREDEGQGELLTSKGFGRNSDFSFIDSETFWCLLDGAPQPTPVESLADDALRTTLSSMKVRLLVPLLNQEKVLACMIVGDRLSGTAFHDDDLELLATLGNSALVALENARLFRETLEKQRLEEELAIARDIQQRLLPAEPPDISGFDFSGLNIPHAQVGGDYYDFIRVNEKELVLTIGDVSGKGVPASLLMANLQASLHAMVHAKWPLTETVFRINNIIHANTSIDKFITFFLASLNVETRELTYVNAGHNPPMLFHKDGKMTELQEGGLILGMMSDVPYEQGTIPLQNGDLLVLFTDGVTEATNPAGEEFTEQGVIDVILRSGVSSAREAVERLRDAVLEFSGDAPRTDDITILTLLVT